MLVKNIMTLNVITVSKSTPVEEIAKLLLERNISAVPVVDDAGRVLGLVSEGDLMRRVADTARPRRSWWLELFSNPQSDAANYIKSHGRNAADIMTKDVITVAEDTSVGDAARILETEHIKRVPVLKSGKLIGIVSRSNLLQTMASTPPAVAMFGVEDGALRDLIFQELSKVPSFEISLVNVIVKDGKTSVWGTVNTDLQQEAARLAVEAVVGEGNADMQISLMPVQSYGYGI
tara:strand:- start:3026 stop:3724 length:699 start_codon:yes stop_codon:yes gene_type:complete